MIKAISRLVREESGQGMAEYGLILALVAVVVIVALTSLGTSIRDTFDKVSGQIGGGSSGSGGTQ